MPDRLDSLMQRLYDHTEQVDWAGPDAVRARGRDRARHQRGVAVLAAAASVGLAATGTILATRPSGTGPGTGGNLTPTATSAVPTVPTLPPPTSAAPTTPPTTPATSKPPTIASPSVRVLTSVPDSALLQPEDLGPGARAEVPLSTDGRFTAWISQCAAADPAWNSWKEAGEDREHSLLTGTGQGGDFVDEIVTPLQRGQADVFLDDIIAVAETCADYVQEYYGTRVRFSKVAEGYAGDRSVLLRLLSGDTTVMLFSFVAQGNLVAEITTSQSIQATRINELSVKAAERMAEAQR